MPTVPPGGGEAVLIASVRIRIMPSRLLRVMLPAACPLLTPGAWAPVILRKPASMVTVTGLPPLLPLGLTSTTPLAKSRLQTPLFQTVPLPSGAPSHLVEVVPAGWYSSNHGPG